jgi:hypothetical protein
MKLCNIIAIFLLISVLDGCAEVSSTRISAYPVYPGVGDMGYVTSGPFPYYYVYPGYDTVYHPGYYLVPAHNDNYHYHQKY